MGSSDEVEETTLEYTPTWTVAVVCSVFVIVSLLLERGIHRLGKMLKKKDQKPLYEALEKLKEELMLLGFISLFLTVFQGSINRLCIPESLAKHMLPCELHESEETTAEEPSSHAEIPSRKLFSLIGSTSRRLLSTGGSGYCEKKGKKPFLSQEGMHQLHIFIFILAIVHVVFCVLTMLLGSAKIRTWKTWEDDIQAKKYDPQDAINQRKFTHVAEDDFVKSHAKWKKSYILSWMASFFKQFYGSVSKADYSTLRLSFIETHCKTNPKFDFHKYMMRTLEADFKKVVGISGYLWFFVVIFLLLNVSGWHSYFWLAFIPLITTYKFDSCIMGRVVYIVPRLVIGVIIQVLCSYSTLPLYALVTQMGTTYKKEIFENHIHEGLSAWHQKVKLRVKEHNTKNEDNSDKGSIQLPRTNGSGSSQMQSRTVHNTTSEIAQEANIEIPNSQ
ncbi:MLO-like protein 1 isoform X3 [Cryptomeria japonica]|uniref:MLO-like protein 1 isoform X3 n=1 Tax=Cryptomeria japonica TaxID=3369 RepID=UPI0025AC932C|nr:MLO-like protein 1 isoform X3 [Cryptomeria japonica]